MSQGFKFKYDEMRSNDPTEKTTGDQDSGVKEENYRSASNVRNVCFVPLDDDEIFLNYAYLVSVRIPRSKDKITLTFTTDTIVLHGINLRPLFKELFAHLPKDIVCIDSRYNTLQEKDASIVNKIEIIPNR